MPKPAKRPVIAVRKPPADPDTFVTEGTKALRHLDTKSTKGAKSKPAAPASSSMHYTRKDGVVLKRTNLYLPADVAKALAIYAVTNERDQSDVATEGVCRLLGLAWPRP